LIYFNQNLIFYEKKTVHLQVRMSVVFIVEPATFQDFEQFIYVIGQQPASERNRAMEG